MKTKKKFYSITLCGLLLFAFNGCREPEIISISATASASTTISIKDSTNQHTTLKYGYDTYVTYSYLPYTADYAQINLRLQVDSTIEQEGGHIDYYDATNIYLSGSHSAITSDLIVEHNQPLPLETIMEIYLNYDTVYNIFIISHVNTAYCNNSNKTDTFVIPVQTHKCEISNIAQQDVSHKENIPIHIPNYHIITSSTITIE